MKPVPPPDQKMRGVYPPGGAFRPHVAPSSGALPSDARLLPSSPPPRDAEVTQVTEFREIRLLGL